jgi:DNA-binding NarL/FixJ family response regulator
MAPRILLVDDHPLTRDGLAALLSGHGFDVVGEAGDGLEAIALAPELHPAVILLDQ